MLDGAPTTTPLLPPSLEMRVGGAFPSLRPPPLHCPIPRLKLVTEGGYLLLFRCPPHVSMTKRAQTMVGHRLGLGMFFLKFKSCISILTMYFILYLGYNNH
jgi:hypothetical protein